MLRSLINSRLGKYYSSVKAKYGVVTPLITALCVFILIYLADEHGIIGMIRSSETAGIVILVVLCLATVSALYYALSKLASKKIGAIDFVAYMGLFLAIMLLVDMLVLSGSTLRTVLFAVGAVVLILLTLFRMSNVKFTEIEIKENLAPNATVATYARAFVKKFNLPYVIFIGLLVFGAVYAFGMQGKSLAASLTPMTVLIIAIALLAVLMPLPKRIASGRMGQLDRIWISLDLAALLCVIPVAIHFSVAHVVIWIVALALSIFFTVLIVKNTHIEEPEKRKAAKGNKGVKVYFGKFAKSYNLFLGAALGLLGFAVLYALLSIDILKGVSDTAATVFYFAVDLCVLAGVLGVLISARKSEVGPNDFVGMILGTMVVLSVIPVIEHFTVINLACWILFVLIFAVIAVMRVLSVVDSETVDAEVYNPKKIFNRQNCVTVLKNVKKTFEGGSKDAHYISNRESRKIAKENMRITKGYEKAKKRKNVPESEYVTQMRDDRNIVEFDNLHTYFFSDAGVVKAVNGVSFDIPQGSTVGVVGESGCGKSVTSLSLMQLVQAPKGQVINDDKIHSEIRFKSTVYKQDEKGQNIPIYEIQLDENGNEMFDDDGNPIYVMEPKTVKGKPVLDKDGNPVMERAQKKDENGIPLYETEEKVYNVAKMPTEVMRKIRGREITMIFQEPMTSLNPIFTIGNQLDEVVLLHVPGATKALAKARTFEMLKMVGIIPENVYDRYPHELSGGMRQRVMIAMALLCHPKLIIADEPTTALDVTIQAQILDLLRDIKKQINGSIMLITHDLGVIAEMADYVVVMYAGRIIEMGTAKEIFDNPLHPYTMGLQKSKPAVNKKVDRLYSIPGSVPNPINMPNYCYFRDRCDKRCDKCNGDYPEMIQISPTHKVSCHLYEKEDANNGNE